MPSPKVIRNHKELQSIQHEIDAAVALVNALEDEKITLHYDATQRQYIDGQWVALLLVFHKSAETFRLRPLLFTKETGNNIAELLCETFQWLSTAASQTL